MRPLNAANRKDAMAMSFFGKSRYLDCTPAETREISRMMIVVHETPGYEWNI